jgi:hypothetical protein
VKDPLFIAGIWAMGSCVVALVLGLLSFVAPLEKRRKLQGVLTVSYLVLGFLTVWALWRIRGEITLFAAIVEPAESSIGLRSLMTLLLLGMGLITHALLAAIGRLRSGQPGTAFRSLIWAIPSVKIITGAGSLLALYDPENLTNPSEFRETFLATAGMAEVGLATWLAIAGGIFLASWPLGYLLVGPQPEAQLSEE